MNISDKELVYAKQEAIAEGKYNIIRLKRR
jgi:hypothetical protein